MEPGFKVWDADGNLIIDSSTRMGTILGWVDTNTSNGSVTHPALGQGLGEVFYASVPIATSTVVVGPHIQLSGNTISWTFRQSGLSSNANFRIFYGYY